MNKHTPGPWEAHTGNAFDGFNRPICAKRNGKYVVIGTAYPDFGDEETESNARLMAAGPVMFSALEDIALFINSAGHTDAQVVTKMQARAMEAIEQATMV
jgi:hypothetical protein